MLTPEEQEWLSLLHDNDDRGMQQIFSRYYKYLVVSSYNILDDDGKAKDVVQDVFFELWKKRDELNITSSLKAYLRRAVVNKSIDEIRSRKKVIFNDELLDTNVAQESGDESEGILELNALIAKAIETLPEKCKVVFKLSRYEDLSHKEIAETLGISTKTIENHITKAMKIVKHFLQEQGQLGILAWLYLILTF